MSEFYDFLDHATDESERKRKYNGKTDCSLKRICVTCAMMPTRIVSNDGQPTSKATKSPRSHTLKGRYAYVLQEPTDQLRDQTVRYKSIAQGMRHDCQSVPSFRRLFDPSACEQHSRCVEKSWRLSNSDIAHASRSQNRITDAEVGKPKYRLRGANTCQQPDHFYFLIETFVQRHDPTASI